MTNYHGLDIDWNITSRYDRPRMYRAINLPKDERKRREIFGDLVG